MQYSLAGVLEGLSYPLPTDAGARGDLRRFWRGVFSPYQQLFWNEADVNNYWAKRSWWEGNRRGISWVSSPVLVLFDAQAKALFLFFCCFFQQEGTDWLHILSSVMEDCRTWLSQSRTDRISGFASPAGLRQRELRTSVRISWMENWEFKEKYRTPKTGLLMWFNIWWDKLKRREREERNMFSRVVTFCDAYFNNLEISIIFIKFIQCYTFGIRPVASRLPVKPTKLCGCT